jgi:hypothetical protein
VAEREANVKGFTEMLKANAEVMTRLSNGEDVRAVSVEQIEKAEGET